MKKSILAVVLGVVGLGVGYAFFAQVGNRYVGLPAVLGLEKGLFSDLVGSLVGIGAIRSKILASGVVGAILGLLLGKK